MQRPEDQRIKNNARARRRREELKVLNLCGSCGKAPRTSKYSCDACRVRSRESQKRSIGRAKAQVFEAYGNKCNCCGEVNLKFLTVDHVLNDCYLDRYTRGSAWYRRVLKLGCPKDRYQLLCFNCNCGRYHNGGVCPHVG